MQKITIAGYETEEKAELKYNSYDLKFADTWKVTPLIYFPQNANFKNGQRNKTKGVVRAIFNTGNGIIFIPSNSFEDFNEQIIKTISNEYEIKKQPISDKTSLEEIFYEKFGTKATIKEQINLVANKIIF